MAKLILIKEHSQSSFYFRQAEWPESWTSWDDYVWEYAVPLILTFFVPKNFETSLKHVHTNLVNSTAKGIIVSLQKIPQQS